MTKYLRENLKELIGFFVIGLLIHMAKITNYLPTWDSVYAMDSSWMGMMGFGRWFSGIATRVLSSRYDLHWLQGVISLILLSVTGVMTLDICGIKNRILRIIAALLIMGFPCVASTLCYINWAPAYYLSYLMAIGALWICRDTNQYNWKKLICASLLLCFSLGIYQIYITTAAVCFLYASVSSVLDGTDIKEEMLRWKHYVIANLAGGVLYLIINKLALTITHVTLGDYQGISAVGKMGVRDLLEAFIRLVQYAGVFFIGELSISFYALISISVLLIILIMWFGFVILNKNYNKKVRLYILGCLVLSVFATYIFVFTSKTTVYHMVMQTGNCFVYLGLLIILEKLDIRGTVYKISLGLLCLLCLYHITNDNVAYKQMEISYERSTFMTYELIHEIDEYYDEGMKVAIIGVPKSEQELVHSIPQITGASPEVYLNSQFHIAQYMKYYCQREYDYADERRITEIMDGDEYSHISVYPKRGYVKVIDDTIVVKLGELGNE